jgi:hypothetical protein
VGLKGEGLFEPGEHGIEPDTRWTDCRSGFHCAYEVEADTLKLRDAYLMLKGERPLLFGKKPVYVPKDYVHVYRGLHVPVAFSGTLLLGGRFIESLGGFGGSSPPWKYEEVHELLLEAGRVLRAEDRSAHMAQAREVLTGGLGLMTPEEHQDMRAWLARDLRLDYVYW